MQQQQQQFRPDRHERVQRYVFTVSLVLACAAVVLLSVALGTDAWVDAAPTRVVDADTIFGARNVTNGQLDTKFNGRVRFGLFHGRKELDHGLGLRKDQLWVSSEMNGGGMLNFGLWVATVVFLSLATVLGLVCMAFALLNATTRPIETITGPIGLYVWNGLAMGFAILSILMFVSLYWSHFEKSVLTPEDVNKYLWTSADRASLGFSFYLVLSSAVLFMLNIVMIAMSGIRCSCAGGNRSDKPSDGVMMY